MHSAAAAEPEVATVRITVTIRGPNPVKPWAKQDPVEATGSGVIIEGKQILTNAHVVRHATEVSGAARPGRDKYEAKVAGIAADVDLALLTVEDDAFFKGRPALPRAKALPKPEEAVVVYGFPVGGDTLSVTKGVISRVTYAMAGVRPTPIIQISAAVNPGNSGGPAIVDGKMVGIVCSRLAGAENIGYILPCEEVEYFLDHLKEGRAEPRPFVAVEKTYHPLEKEAPAPLPQLDKGVKGSARPHTAAARRRLSVQAVRHTHQGRRF